MNEEQPTVPPAPQEKVGGLPPEELHTPFLETNLKSLIAGVAVVAVIIAAGTYVYLQRTTKKTPPSAKQTVTPTTTPPPSQLGKVVPKTPSERVVEDQTFSYRMRIPENWEAFKRVDQRNAYQLGIRPVGSTDVPMTFNVQVNEPNFTLDEAVNFQFGPNYPREKKLVNGKDAVVVRNDLSGYQSYFMARGNKLYELSVSTAREDYRNTFNQLLKTFTFTN